MQSNAALRICRQLIVIASLACCLPAQANDPLPSWNDSAAKKAIVSFVESTSTEGSPKFVPAAERIAVFDNDGTLWAEQPMYFQAAFILDRVKALAPQHPEWKSEEPFKSVLEGNLKGVEDSGQEGVLKLVAATHAGVTTDEFDKAVNAWLESAQHPRFKRSYLECVYQPQLELLAYLRSRGFKTYIVSGGGVDFMRPWTEKVYGIPPEQVVGSSIKAKYEVRDGVPTLVKLPELNFINDKEGKPVGIHHLIGRRPIMAVGNSDGDYQMLEYVTAAAGPTLGVIVHHTDGEREYAYDRQSPFGHLDRALDDADGKHWIVIDMKNDWRHLFPVGSESKDK